MNAEEALKVLHTFLVNRHWVVEAGAGRFESLRPPKDLGLGSDFVLTLPLGQSGSELWRVLGKVVPSVAEVYEMTTDQLEPVLYRPSTILALRMEDDQNPPGTIAFSRLEEVLDRLRRLFTHIATFAIQEDPVVDGTPIEAETYVSKCRFLPTGKGSFIANIELPREGILRQETLLGSESLSAEAVTDKLIDVLRFTNAVVKGGHEPFSEEHFQAHGDVINLNVLEDVEQLIERAGYGALEFSFIDVALTRRVETPAFSDDDIDRFGKYVQFVRSRVLDSVNLEIRGRVVELRSRNPRGNRNFVLVLSRYEHQSVYVAVALNNTLYQVAVRAHRLNHDVRVRGRARRMKTQLRVVELLEFSEADY